MQDNIMTPDCLKQKYQYQRLLGEGANGKTWLAQSCKSEDVLVAVKELKLSKVDNNKRCELFEREAEVLKSISVQGVPKFYDCISDDQGTCYLVQQYVKYPSLQSLVDENGEFSEKMTLAILLAVTDLLVELHMHYSPPIIHRDIKPSNILCDLDFKHEYVKSLYLIDFGAVANPQKRSSGSTIAGTFGYMSPEQLMGEVTPQSDFYALGATALYLLVGIAPYKLPTNVFKIKTNAIMDEFAPNVSNQMRALINTLLAPEIEIRPKNARVLREMLRNVNIGRMPDDNSGGSICDEYLKSLRDETGKQYQKRYRTDAEMKRMNMCYGLVRAISIRKVSNIRNIVCAEYTFDAFERTWCGVCPINADLYKIKTPTVCAIRYDVSNPRFNFLEKVGDQIVSRDVKDAIINK